MCKLRPVLQVEATGTSVISERENYVFILFGRWHQKPKASVLHADCRVHLYIHTNRLMDHRQNALRKQMLVHSGYILFFLSGVRFYWLHSAEKDALKIDDVTSLCRDTSSAAITESHEREEKNVAFRNICSQAFLLKLLNWEKKSAKKVLCWRRRWFFHPR